ncbi:MAG: porin [Pseudomonadota bacterium]
MKLKFVAALLAGGAFCISAPAFAQDPQTQDQAPANPDQSDAAADAAIAQAGTLEDAQAKLEMLQAQVEALQTSIEAMRKDSVKETPAWKNMDWASSTKITGKAFFNVSNISQSHTDLLGNTTNDVQEGTQTELKRFYLGVEHKFDDMFSANLTTDFRYNANGTSKDVLVYVKKAYLQAKFSPALAVRVGAADLPWVPFVEGLYGYRFIENTLIDRTKFGTSADWGVHLGGTFGNNLVSYAVSAINGAGYKTLSRNSNTIDLEGRVSVNPIKEITLAIGGYSGKLGKSNETVNINHRATRWNAVAAYTGSRIRAGVEYFAAKNWNNITTAALPNPAPVTIDDKSSGWSAFGSFAFTPKIGLFGRYDWVKPSKDLRPGLKDQYFNVGLNYKPVDKIDLALVYKRDRAKNGTISTSNGTIGGADDGKYKEVGLFGQLAF